MLADEYVLRFNSLSSHIQPTEFYQLLLLSSSTVFQSAAAPGWTLEKTSTAASSGRCLQALKTLLIISSFLIWTTSFGQFNRYVGTWISDQQDCMFIQDTINKYDNSNMLCTVVRDEGMALFVYGDTLSFQKRYYSSSTNYENLYVDRYDLKILKFNDTSIVVRPVSKLSKKFLQDRDKITFIKREFKIDNSLKFEKIVFHTTECFGRCNVYHLQVDSSRLVRLHRQLVYGQVIGAPIDTAIEGYFTGRLSDTSFEKLIRALQTCNLRTLRMNNTLCCDGSVSTIVVYFNGQRKYFKTMFPPTVANELISILYNICDEKAFTKTFDKFKLEE